MEDVEREVLKEVQFEKEWGMTGKEYVEGKGTETTHMLPPQGLCTCCSLSLDHFP